MADLWKLPGVSADAKKKPVDPKKRAVQGVKMAAQNVKSNLKKSVRSRPAGKYELEGSVAPKGTNKEGISQAREGLAEATSKAKDAGVKGSKVRRMTKGTGGVRAQKPAKITDKLLGSNGKRTAQYDVERGKVEKPGEGGAREQVTHDKIVSAKKAAKWDAKDKAYKAKQVKGYDKVAGKAVRSGKAQYK
jgi:hypothetical protein